MNITAQTGSGRRKVNKKTCSDKTRTSRPHLALCPLAARRAAGPARSFRVPRLSRAASELLHRYFAMQPAQAAADAR